MSGLSQNTFTSADGPPDRFMLLVLRYLDGRIEGHEREELNEALRSDPALRRRFLDHCTQECLIREALPTERPGVTGSAKGREAERARRRRRPEAPFRLAGAIAAAVVLGAMVSVWALTPRRGSVPPPQVAAPAPAQEPAPNPAVVLASLEAVTGTALVDAPGAGSRPAHDGSPVRAGDTLRLTGSGARAEVAYADGTRILLVGNTSVTFATAAAKLVTVSQGTLFVSVTPQPADKPMMFATAAAKVEVLGTRLALSADETHTEVRVNEGRVRLTHSLDGRSVEVPRGKSTVASKSAGREVLAVSDIPQPPDTWEVDFENGLPAGFERGRFVTEGLPRASKGAVRTGPVDKRHMGEEGVYYEVITAEHWYDGMFRVHPDTHLHFTYRMDEPGWVNVFILARSPGPPRVYEINYLFNELRFWPPEPGKWKTVSIPVSRFNRLAGPRGSGKPFENEVPYRMLFSSPGDRGLVIDRVWVTRGGPGVVSYSDVP